MVNAKRGGAVITLTVEMWPAEDDAPTTRTQHTVVDQSMMSHLVDLIHRERVNMTTQIFNKADLWVTIQKFVADTLYRRFPTAIVGIDQETKHEPGDG